MEKIEWKNLGALFLFEPRLPPANNKATHKATKNAIKFHIPSLRRSGIFCLLYVLPRLSFYFYSFHAVEESNFGGPRQSKAKGEKGEFHTTQKVNTPYQADFAFDGKREAGNVKI